MNNDPLERDFSEAMDDVLEKCGRNTHNAHLCPF